MGRRKKLSSAKAVKIIKTVNALKKTGTLKDAYKETHPGCSDESARKNGKNILTPEVMAAFKEAMEIEALASATRPVLEKALFTVVARWYAGQETTQNLISAIRELTKLVPEWSEKIQIQEADDESTVKAKLKELGVDPDSIHRN